MVAMQGCSLLVHHVVNYVILRAMLPNERGSEDLRPGESDGHHWHGAPQAGARLGQRDGHGLGDEDADTDRELGEDACGW